MLHTALKTFYTVQVLAEYAVERVCQFKQEFSQKYARCPFRDLFSQSLGNSCEIEELRRDLKQLRVELDEVKAMMKSEQEGLVARR